MWEHQDKNVLTSGITIKRDRKPEKENEKRILELKSTVTKMKKFNRGFQRQICLSRRERNVSEER